MFRRVDSFSEFSEGQIVAPTKGAETVTRVNSAIRHLSSEFGRCTLGHRPSRLQLLLSRYTKAFGLSSVIKTVSEPSRKC